MESECIGDALWRLELECQVQCRIQRDAWIYPSGSPGESWKIEITIGVNIEKI